MKFLCKVLMLPVLTMFAASVHATAISGASPLPFAADVVIDFDSYDAGTDGPPATAYNALGVNFSSVSLGISPPPPAYAGFSGLNLFTGGATQPNGGPHNDANTLEIAFNGEVLAAAFRLITNPNTTMFEALKGGSVIETFSAFTGRRAVRTPCKWISVEPAMLTLRRTT